ncbi:MAG: ABC transporter ATP-binding protein [Sedimentisphaerales bacterium]|nr:ABC transporter ATP-binding protein [Sedimentisphaerales bacterium]
MSDKSDIIIKAQGIHKSYTLDKRKQVVLHGVDLEVGRGEFLAVMGSSGSGKSTLLHILGLLDKPDQGRVDFEDRSVFDLSGFRQDRIRNREIGFVFQFYHLLPELNVLENVLLPMMVRSSLLSWFGTRRQAKRRARELVEEVGLGSQTKQRPATLSGGERQRVALARALMADPKLLLADEPTGNLDSASGKAILELLGRRNKAGQTIVMVTHDHSVAALAERKLVLQDGVLS